jgi:tetratricopeptide (TPR) repeat protein
MPEITDTQMQDALKSYTHASDENLHQTLLKYWNILSLTRTLDLFQDIISQQDHSILGFDYPTPFLLERLAIIKQASIMGVDAAWNMYLSGKRKKRQRDYVRMVATKAPRTLLAWIRSLMLQTQLDPKSVQSTINMFAPILNNLDADKEIDASLEVLFTQLSLSLPDNEKGGFTVPPTWVSIPTSIYLLFERIDAISQPRDYTLKLSLASEARDRVEAGEGDALLLAYIQRCIGIWSLENTGGDKDQNVEDSLKACTAALKVWTERDFPVDWAATQFIVGRAYTERQSGSPAHNIEHAIDAYNKALTVYLREIFPIQWAETMGGLGIAYTNRKMGVFPHNLQMARKYFQAALEVFKIEDFPEEFQITNTRLTALDTMLSQLQ